MLTKEQARAQFDHHTKVLNLKHTFTFDEAWEFMEHKRKEKEQALIPKEDRTIAKYRHDVVKFEDKMRKIPGALIERKDIDKVNPLKHTFTDGCCVREIFNPKGELLVTKIHKREHPYFLLKGEMSIMTENGLKRVKAPHYGITKVGTKRIIYTHEDCVFVTVHVTEHKDVEKLEEEHFATDFKDVKQLEVQKFIEILKEDQL